MGCTIGLEITSGYGNKTVYGPKSDCSYYNDIGSSKIYKCSNCNKTYDRDIKSAGCIYLKALQ